MKHLLITFFATALVAGEPLAAALPATTTATNSPAFSKADEEQFYSQLQAGLKKSQDRVGQLQRAGSGMQNEMALESAQATYAIKQTMFTNFKGTPAIQFPEIRQQLLSLFQKDEVGAQDLVALQQAIYDWEQSAKH